MKTEIDRIDRYLIFGFTLPFLRDRIVLTDNFAKGYLWIDAKWGSLEERKSHQRNFLTVRFETIQSGKRFPSDFEISEWARISGIFSPRKKWKFGMRAIRWQKRGNNGNRNSRRGPDKQPLNHLVELLLLKNLNGVKKGIFIIYDCMSVFLHAIICLKVGFGSPKHRYYPSESHFIGIKPIKGARARSLEVSWNQDSIPRYFAQNKSRPHVEWFPQTWGCWNIWASLEDLQKSMNWWSLKIKNSFFQWKIFIRNHENLKPIEVKSDKKTEELRGKAREMLIGVFRQNLLDETMSEDFDDETKEQLSQNAIEYGQGFSSSISSYV